MDDLSRGLRDETACVTFRDRATDFLAAQGAHDKFASSLKAPREKLEHCYADGARELARACCELKAARDPTTPGNKKQSAVAERANGAVQMGARALLMQAGLPPPCWTYAAGYLCLCYNARAPEEGKSSWGRRFGRPFEAPLLPFGPLVRYMPPPESRLRAAKTGGAMIPGLSLGQVHEAGGLVGPESYVVPLRQLDGLNMESWRTPEGQRPAIEKSDQ
eukprot:8383574-Pyramimonas_sp.AAC.1